MVKAAKHIRGVANSLELLHKGAEHPQVASTGLPHPLHLQRLDVFKVAADESIHEVPGRPIVVDHGQLVASGILAGADDHDVQATIHGVLPNSIEGAA